MFMLGLVAQMVLIEWSLLAAQAVPDAVAAADAPSRPSAFGNVDGTVQMQVLILLTTIAGFVFNAWMQKQKAREDRAKEERRISEEQRKDTLRVEDEGRKRAWDLEDRMHAREEAIKRMQLVHTKIDTVRNEAQLAASHAATAVLRVEERSDQLDARLAENTEISKQAFSEANNFNAKLGEVIRRFDASEATLEVSKTTVRAVPQDEDDAGSTEAPPRDTE